MDPQELDFVPRFMPRKYACMHAYALPGGARHARSKATRVVTANCTSHRIKTAHNTH